MTARYVKRANEVTLRSGKLTTMRKVASCGLKTPTDIFVVVDAAFRQYAEYGYLPEAVEAEIKSALAPLLARGEVGIRCAFFIPNEKLRQWPMPITKNFTMADDCLEHITKTCWDFVIAKGLDVPGSEIALLLQNFICPFASGTLLTSYDAERQYSFIEAIYGIWEGLQSRPHDFYLLRKSNWRLVQASIGRKKEMLMRTGCAELRFVPVPDVLQDEPVLPETLAREVAQQGQLLEDRYGPQIVEFFIEESPSTHGTNQDVILVWQCDGYQPASDVTMLKGNAVMLSRSPVAKTLVFCGPVIAISTREEVPKSVGDGIVFLHGSIVEDRDWVITKLARILDKGQPVLLTAGITSHLAQVLCDWGLFPISTAQKFSTGQWVDIQVNKNGIRIAVED